MDQREKRLVIEDIQRQIQLLGRTLRLLVDPSPEEVRELLADVQQNPELWVEQFQNDDLFIAWNVWEEREARREVEEDPNEL